MKAHRFLWVVVLSAVCAAAFADDAHAGDKLGAIPMTTASVSARGEGAMPDLGGAIDWLNSKPLTAAGLRGKVVLIDFWTYTCINWQRTLPHLRAWADKYKGQGLVVIGVHSPEFGFEKDVDNVRAASAQLKVDFPIAVDSERAIWRAFANQYWPALYVVDARGTIRFHHFGEGAYERSEQAIQQLLVEAGAKDVDTALVQVEGAGSLAQADWKSLRSGETYVGRDRAENFASPGGIGPARTHVYEAPERLPLNRWALAGEWNVERELATPTRANGRIVYRFHARDLNLVMGPKAKGMTVPFRVLIDGRPPGHAHGADVDAEGRGLLVEPRMYQLIRQAQPIEDRQFEIEFLEPGVEVFSFTFG
jgi:thiol-disulfide isomerase/thioredoxin